MYIFSSSPRNQLPNHGLRAGDKYYWQEVPATTSSNSEPQLLTEKPAAQPWSACG